MPTQDKVKFFVIALLVVVVIIIIKISIAQTKEGKWLCRNGKWVMYGQTAKPRPPTPCK